jgi:hypothetical protein
MVELMIVLVVLTISMSMFSGTLIATARQGQIKAETAIASDALRAKVETMRGEAFEQLFARYDANPADDPGGAGSAPGKDFAITGLAPAAGDADGMCGEILFPTIRSALREDVDDAALSMPRDLNGDGAIDAADHKGDYRILPVHLRATWNDDGTPHSLDIYTMIVKL